MSISALGRLKNHRIPHIHPNFRKCMSLNRHQLKIYEFSIKFNVRSKCVNQNLSRFYARYSDFYSEFLSNNFVAGGVRNCQNRSESNFQLKHVK